MVFAMLGEGAYGKVFRGQDHLTGEFIAVKVIDYSTEPLMGIPSSAIRELSILKSLNPSAF